MAQFNFSSVNSTAALDGKNVLFNPLWYPVSFRQYRLSLLFLTFTHHDRNERRNMRCFSCLDIGQWSI